MIMNKSQKPELDVQRRIIEQKRDQFRAHGFETELEVTTLRVQEVASEAEGAKREEMIQDLETKVRNCYRSAEELQSLLAKLPKLKQEKVKA